MFLHYERWEGEEWSPCNLHDIRWSPWSGHFLPCKAIFLHIESKNRVIIINKPCTCCASQLFSSIPAGKEVGTTFMWTEQDLHKSLACQPVLAGSLHYWKCFNGQLASNIYSHLVIYCKSPRVISDSTFSPFRPPPAILLHFPPTSTLCLVLAFPVDWAAASMTGI